MNFNISSSKIARTNIEIIIKYNIGLDVAVGMTQQIVVKIFKFRLQNLTSFAVRNRRPLCNYLAASVGSILTMCQLYGL